ncbi:MAG: putative reverse transcriptase, partial [Streblomastix strix]
EAGSISASNRERIEPQINEGHDDNADEEEDEQTDEAALNQNKDYRVNIITQPPAQENLSTQSQNVQGSNASSQIEKDDAGPAPIGVQEKSKKRESKAIMPKNKLPKLLNPKLLPKEVRKQLKRQNPNQKTLKKRVKGSRIPDLAGTLQPREISVEISHWNRGEERADDNCSSGERGKDWRIDIQRENRWKGGQDKKNSQQRLEENKIIIPFRGTQEEKKAYQEMLKEELEEGIVISIQQDQVKWWNHTFLINKPNGTWRKILDASKLNKEIEKLHFKMHGLEEVQNLANQMDYATSLDLKSAFHHITVSPNSIPYLAFNFNNNNYAYKAMPFGTKRSPIFFAEAIESILRQIRIHSEIKILNYCDDILLIHQDKLILKTQTMEIMRTLEQFGWTISTDKCETEPKQIITFLGWIWNLKEMNIRMSEERKSKMIQALKDWCNTIYKSKNVKIRQLAALIGRLNFLRPQIKEASLYLTELDKAKTQALKTGLWDGIMIVNKVVIKELKWWIRRIGDNQPESLSNKTLTCILTTDSSPQGWGATLIYDNQIELIQHDSWNKKEVEMTSNAKEIKAIYYGLLRFEQVFKNMQDQAILIRSDNTTAVYDIGKWKAKESMIERIKQIFYLVKRLKLQITTTH